jgi:transposase-like protein
MFVGTGTVRKAEEREEARRLRREHGMPIKQTAALLGVSPSTVSYWVRDIEITPAQRERNLRGPRGPHNPEHIAARTKAWAETARNRRRNAQLEGRMRARKGDALHQAGCMLFWAEGSRNRNQVRLCNSDPHRVRFFRRFLTECFSVPPDRFRIRLHVYLGNGLSLEEIEQHWLDVLDLPASCMRGHSVNPLPTSSSGKKKNKLPYGVCTLSVGATEIVQHIYGAIQEYGGFEEPSWLDGPLRKARPGRQANGSSAQE